MQAINLRAATQKDASQIRALIYKVKINPFDLNWRHFTLAVNAQDEMLGCGQIKPHGDGSRELASIAVQPAYHGQRIGSRLVQTLIERETPPLYLTCRAEMATFYTRFGFAILAPNQMPPYFRRINRIAAFLQSLSPGIGELRIMRRE